MLQSLLVSFLSVHFEYCEAFVKQSLEVQLQSEVSLNFVFLLLVRHCSPSMECPFLKTQESVNGSLIQLLSGFFRPLTSNAQISKPPSLNNKPLNLLGFVPLEVGCSIETQGVVSFPDEPQVNCMRAQLHVSDLLAPQLNVECEQLERLKQQQVLHYKQWSLKSRFSFQNGSLFYKVQSKVILLVFLLFPPLDNALLEVEQIKPVNLLLNFIHFNVVLEYFECSLN